MTKCEYDAANQLVAQTTDAGTAKEKRVEFAYDGAGRMVREGEREYRYGGLDKVVAVLEAGRTVAEFAYGADGQLANVTRQNGENERLWWRGLALTRRDYLNGKEVVSSERYLNEPHPGGGNPMLAWESKAAPASAKERAKAAATRLLFNDMLGSTLAVLDGDKAQDTGMTLFGETPDGQGAGFFNGKPHVDELGYTFLFRNYRPDKAKWQTADPLGYPDWWNCLAYCNSMVSSCVDVLGTDIYHVVASKSVGGLGHSGAIVGTQQSGYRIINHGAVNTDPEKIHSFNNVYKTLSDALKALCDGRGENEQFDKIQKWDTDEKTTQDDRAYDKMLKRASEPYDTLTNNCYDVVAAGIEEAFFAFSFNSLIGYRVSHINIPNVAFLDNSLFYGAQTLNFNDVLTGKVE